MNLVENKLRKLESSHASTLNKILREKKLHKSQWEKLSDIVLQLGFRTKNFRFQAKDTAEKSLEKALNEIDKHELARDTIIQGFRNNFNRKPNAKEVHQLTPIVLKELENKIIPETKHLLRGIPWEQPVRDASIKIIADGTPEYGHRYRNYVWKLQNGDSELLLGDVCVLALSTDSEVYEPAILVSGKNTDHVVLPISSTEYICGYDPDKGMKIEPPSVKLLNEASIRLSNEFIVAKTEFPINMALFRNEIWGQYPLTEN